MALADAAGSQSGKYTVDVRGSLSVQVGDHNRQRTTPADRCLLAAERKGEEWLSKERLLTRTEGKEWFG